MKQQDESRRTSSSRKTSSSSSSRRKMSDPDGVLDASKVEGDDVSVTSHNSRRSTASHNSRRSTTSQTSSRSSPRHPSHKSNTKSSSSNKLKSSSTTPTTPSGKSKHSKQRPSKLVKEELDKTAPPPPSLFSLRNEITDEWLDEEALRKKAAAAATPALRSSKPKKPTITSYRRRSHKHRTSSETNDSTRSPEFLNHTPEYANHQKWLSNPFVKRQPDGEFDTNPGSYDDGDVQSYDDDSSSQYSEASSKKSGATGDQWLFHDNNVHKTKTATTTKAVAPITTTTTAAKTAPSKSSSSSKLSKKSSSRKSVKKGKDDDDDEKKQKSPKATRSSSSEDEDEDQEHTTTTPELMNHEPEYAGHQKCLSNPFGRRSDDSDDKHVKTKDDDRSKKQKSPKVKRSSSSKDEDEDEEQTTTTTPDLMNHEPEYSGHQKWLSNPFGRRSDDSDDKHEKTKDDDRSKKQKSPKVKRSSRSKDEDEDEEQTTTTTTTPDLMNHEPEYSGHQKWLSNPFGRRSDDSDDKHEKTKAAAAKVKRTSSKKHPWDASPDDAEDEDDDESLSKEGMQLRALPQQQQQSPARSPPPPEAFQQHHKQQPRQLDLPPLQSSSAAPPSTDWLSAQLMSFGTDVDDFLSSPIEPTPPNNYNNNYNDQQLVPLDDDDSKPSNYYHNDSNPYGNNNNNSVLVPYEQHQQLQQEQQQQQLEPYMNEFMVPYDTSNKSHDLVVPQWQQLNRMEDVDLLDSNHNDDLDFYNNNSNNDNSMMTPYKNQESQLTHRRSLGAAASTAMVPAHSNGTMVSSSNHQRQMQLHNTKNQIQSNQVVPYYNECQVELFHDDDDDKKNQLSKGPFTFSYRMTKVSEYVENSFFENSGKHPDDDPSMDALYKTVNPQEASVYRNLRVAVCCLCCCTIILVSVLATLFFLGILHHRQPPAMEPKGLSTPYDWMVRDMIRLMELQQDALAATLKKQYGSTMFYELFENPQNRPHFMSTTPLKEIPIGYKRVRTQTFVTKIAQVMIRRVKAAEAQKNNTYSSKNKSGRKNRWLRSSLLDGREDGYEGKKQAVAKGNETSPTTTTTTTTTTEQLLNPNDIFEPFVWVTAGSDNAAALGNLYDESYTHIMYHSLVNVFAAAGLEFVARNFAIAGLKSSPELAMCMEATYGTDVDMLLWDFGMTDHDIQANLHFFAARAGVHPNHPAFIVMGDKPYWMPVLRELSKQGLPLLYFPQSAETSAYEVLPDSLRVDPSIVNQFPSHIKNLKCNGLLEMGSYNCDQGKFNLSVCPDRRFRMEWYPGWKLHALRGYLMAYSMMDLLRDALFDIRDNGMTASTDTMMNHILKIKQDKQLEMESFSTVVSRSRYAQSIRMQPDDKDNNTVNLDLIYTRPNICHTGLIPAETRYWGILTNSVKNTTMAGNTTKTNTTNINTNTNPYAKKNPKNTMALPTDYDKGIYFWDAMAAPNNVSEMRLVYETSDRQVCEVPLNVGFADYWLVTGTDEVEQLAIVPNAAEMKAYGRPENKWMDGETATVVACMAPCRRSVCTIDDIRPENVTELLDIRINGQQVTGGSIWERCMYFHHTDGFAFDSDSEGRFQISVKVKKRPNYVRFSSFVVYSNGS